jgi:hypothetical protein
MKSGSALVGLAVATAAIGVRPAHAEDGERLLAEVQADGDQDCPTITLRFLTPIRFLGVASATPLESRLLIEPAAGGEFVARDTLLPPTGSSLIQTIAWERNVTGGSALVLGLSAPAKLEAALGHDAASIVLRVAGGGGATECDGTAETRSQSLVPLDRAVAAEERSAAEEYILAKNYEAAASILDCLLRAPDHEQTMRAIELRALVYERNGEVRRARAMYEDYLRRTANNEGAQRIQERLAGLPSDRAEKAAAIEEEKDRWRTSVIGSVSQFYQRDNSRNTFITTNRPVPVEEIDERVNIDQLLSAADVTVTSTKRSTRVSVRAAGSYTSDFRPVTIVGASRSEGRDTARLFALNVDIRDTDKGISARLGRQSLYGSGVFGRFDGGRIGWRPHPAVQLHAQAGVPVPSSRLDYADWSKWFYGFSVGYQPPNTNLEVTAYWQDQYAQGLSDRRSIGVEGRYASDKFAVFGVADFNVKFGKLDRFLLSATIPVAKSTTISAQIEQQYYPRLALSNARIGQSVSRLSDLKGLFGPGLERLAEDRSANSLSFHAIVTTTLSRTWTGVFDGVLTRTSATRPSGGVQQIEGTGTESYVSAQLVGSGVLKPRDTFIIGTRHADTAKFRITAGEVRVQMPVTGRVIAEPRFELAHRSDKFGSGHRTTYRPALRAIYRFGARTALDAEVEQVWFSQNHDSPGYAGVGKSKERSTAFSVGYRQLF